MKIVNLRAEKKSPDIALLTWGVEPNVLGAPYQVWRRMVHGDTYEAIGNGIGTAFVDDLVPVVGNEFYEYRVVSEGAEAEVQLYRQGDPWVLAVASDYFWQLDYAYNASIAVAYCLNKTSVHCPECFSVELNKITKSKCETCDGSGKLVSYIGPIPFKYAPLQYVRNMDNLGNAERDKEMISAWTANIPLFNVGDIVINKDHKKFMVQDIPSRIFLHSKHNNDEFIPRQNITLRKLDDDEYAKLTYYENLASNHDT